jgi:hypothetical protein
LNYAPTEWRWTHAISQLTPEAGAPKEFAMEALAKVLFEKMEHLDPSDDEADWSVLSEADRQFYRSCIDRLALEVNLLAVLIR